jgi:multidrug resistance efflux pump
MSALTNPAPSPAQRSPQRIAPVAPQPPEKKPVPWKGWLIFVAVVGGTLFAYQRWDSAQQQAAQRNAVATIRTATVTSGSFERTIRVGGVTTARQFANIIAPRLRGPEARNQMELLRLIKNGTWVKPGEELAQVDPGYLVDHVDDIKATIDQAKLDVEKRKAEQEVESEGIRQTLRVNQSAVDKAKLDNQAAEVRTDIERELLNLAQDEAIARYKQSELDVPQKAIVHGSELKILGYTTERHVRHHDRHVNDIKAFTVFAPMEGLVVLSSAQRGGGESNQVQQGDQVNPGQPLLKVVNPKSMQVEATINQAESTLIRIGQKATIGVDAFPGMQLKGTIYSIGALAAGGFRQNYYIRTVPVRISIDEADPRLIPDLSASADVVLETQQNATMVPLGAIRREAGKAFVYVKQGEGFAKREVTVSKANYLQAVVTSGVKAGDVVRLD